MNDEDLKATLEFPDHIDKKCSFKGQNGGLCRDFSKKLEDGTILHVIAEVKKSEAWIITTYYE